MNSNRTFAHAKNLCKIGAKNLSVEQKANRLEICQDLLGRLEIEPHFLHKVITGDKSWVFDYDPETKRQSEEWHTKSSRRRKKARMSRSRVKTMIIVFFDSHSIVHKELCTSRTDSQSRLLQRCLRTTSKTGPAGPKGHCRQLGAATR